MATYTFPALGFDPAPGDPDASEAVARDCLRCASDLAADADQLRGFTAHVDWQLDAARRLQAGAEDDFEAAVARARRSSTTTPRRATAPPRGSGR